MPPTSEITEPELANGDSANYHRKMDRRLIVLETRFDTILPTLATKADLIGLQADLIGLKAELRGDIGELRAEMRAMHAELKAEMHKWMAATAITLFVGFGGMFLAMVALPRPG